MRREGESIMRRLLLAGALLGLILVLTACGSDDALPSLPGSIVEAPVETMEPIDQNFDWSDLFDEDDNDGDGLVFDSGYDGNGEFAFDFGDDSTQIFFPPLEEAPAEMVLEHGIPLEGTDQDLSGLLQQNPVTAESVNGEGEELPLLEVEVPVEPIITVDFDEPQELPQTNDPLTATAVALAFSSLAIIIYIFSRKNVV